MLVPNRTTVTSPVDETTITDGSVDAHVVSPVTSFTAPSEKVTTAVSWLVSAIAVNDALPVTFRRVNRAGPGVGTGTGVGVVTLLLHAVKRDATTRTQAQQPGFMTAWESHHSGTL